MKIICCMLAAAGFVHAATGDVEVDLANALKRLAAHKNYAWETIITPATVSIEITPPAPRIRPLDETDFRPPPPSGPVPILGRTDTERGTLIEGIVSSFGDPLSMRIVIWGDRRAAETPEGWLTQREIEDAAAAVRQTKRRLPAPPAPENIYNIGNHRISKSAYFYAGRFYISIRPPFEELQMLFSDAGPAMGMERKIVRTLSESAARTFWHDLRFRDGGNSTENAPSSVEGNVTIWLKGDEIAKYEVVITGDVAACTDDPTYKGREHTIRLVKTTILSGFDRTKVSIPREVLAKLGP
jgi:hypothetical protein